MSYKKWRFFISRGLQWKERYVIIPPISRPSSSPYMNTTDHHTMKHNHDKATWEKPSFVKRESGVTKGKRVLANVEADASVDFHLSGGVVESGYGHGLGFGLFGPS